MQTKTYTGKFKVTLLHEELEQIPGMKDNWTATYDGETFVINFPDSVPEAAVSAVIQDHVPTAETRDERFRNKVNSLTQSAVGVKLMDLTAAQLKAVLAVLLVKMGAVDPETLSINPLDEWF